MDLLSLVAGPGVEAKFDQAWKTVIWFFWFEEIITQFCCTVDFILCSRFDACSNHFMVLGSISTLLCGSMEFKGMASVTKGQTLIGERRSRKLHSSNGKGNSFSIAQIKMATEPCISLQCL